jgi:aryl-alcohol dehydrogenase-like predicted oxidoreductase
MEYAGLGRTGLKVSRLCLGTMNFGPLANEAESFAVMDRALEDGINFFDTADVYGGSAGKGATEEIIGRWLAQGGERRERVALATKVFGRMGNRPNEGRLSAYHIRRACEESLRRLRTDHLDLYQMHHVDRDTPWEEIWQAMEILVRHGKVLYCGSSNFAAWHIACAQNTADKRHFLGLVSEQSLYNLTERRIELEVLPACRALGLGFLPWSPLAGGILGGRGGATGRRTNDMAKQRIEIHQAALAAYEAFCSEVSESPATVSLAWLLAQPGVTSVVIGPRTISQLTDCYAALEMELTEQTLLRLDEIWPGPGNAAPEAYAW